MASILMEVQPGIFSSGAPLRCQSSKQAKKSIKLRLAIDLPGCSVSP